MSSMWKFAVGTMVIGACLSTSPLVAREEADQPKAVEDREESWYHQEPAPFRPNPRAIIFQKASYRAEQRQQRLASTSWYGMSNSRPTAAGTPFTSMYSPAWQSPGGRPFAWYASGQPTYAILTR